MAGHETGISTLPPLNADPCGGPPCQCVMQHRQMPRKDGLTSEVAISLCNRASSHNVLRSFADWPHARDGMGSASRRRM
eukprot:XP_001707981.1 Hypothetical protein GL50803_120486 [Giardia lamblia ATCC 50803]